MLSFLQLLSTAAVAAAAAAAGAGAGTSDIDDMPFHLDTFVHEASPGYRLDSVNPASLGIDTVKQEAGYLGAPSGNRLFYWFFESRSNPSKDPVLVWLNGGPGCSSLEAVLFENGPSNIQANGQLQHNPWSWNNYANVLYIDNPSGVGYSTSGKEVTDTVTASEDFKNIIRMFFEKNPQFKSNGLHISGESYAGRYIPVFATAINEDPQSPIKVDSVLIGNGLVNPVAEYASYAPMLCGQGGYSAALDQQACQRIQAETPACTRAMTTCMNNLGSSCIMAQLECSGIQRSFQNKNPYDIRDTSCERSETGLCYSVLDTVQQYFNDPKVRRALGADDGSSNQQYQLCNNQMNAAFYQNEDPFEPTFRNITTLLETGVPVLAYNGDADIILNWLGARQWTSELQWSGQAGFQQAGQQPVSWTPHNKGQKLGEVTNYGNFTFLRVAGAGHMVPHDQPESAHYMVRSWLSGDHAFRKNF